jgi:carboxylate-amine ligase
MDHAFTGPSYTIGIEEELMIVDAGSYELVNAVESLLEDAPEGERLRRAVAVEARDRATLLADWLGELAFLAETEGLVPERVAELELEDRALRAVVEGRRGSPAHLVKAATYHRLALERTGDRLRARGVLDV